MHEKNDFQWFLNVEKGLMKKRLLSQRMKSKVNGLLSQRYEFSSKLMKGFMWDKDNSSTMNQMFHELLLMMF